MASGLFLSTIALAPNHRRMITKSIRVMIGSGGDKDHAANTEAEKSQQKVDLWRIGRLEKSCVAACGVVREKGIRKGPFDELAVRKGPRAGTRSR